MRARLAGRARWALWPLVAASGFGCGDPVGNAAPAATHYTSAAGLYRASYRSELEPLAINRIHGWVLRLETAGGEPVTDADLVIAGGMPAHDHGLPTAPRATGHLGDGNYRIEGVRFHMNGAWEITVTISAGRGRDTLVIPVEV